MPDEHGAVPLGRPGPEPGEEQGNPSLEERIHNYPPGLPQDLRPSWREFRRIQEANMAAEARLAAYGAGITPDSINKLRLQVLIDMLFPPDAGGWKSRLEHDRRYQELLASQWDGLQSAVVQALLAQGSNVPPEMLAAYERQVQAPGPRGNQHRPRRG